jgi:hypothetical protein
MCLFTWDARGKNSSENADCPEETAARARRLGAPARLQTGGRAATGRLILLVRACARGRRALHGRRTI